MLLVKLEDRLCLAGGSRNLVSEGWEGEVSVASSESHRLPVLALNKCRPVKSHSLGVILTLQSHLAPKLPIHIY